MAIAWYKTICVVHGNLLHLFCTWQAKVCGKLLYLASFQTLSIFHVLKYGSTLYQDSWDNSMVGRHTQWSQYQLHRNKSIIYEHSPSYFCNQQKKMETGPFHSSFGNKQTCRALQAITLGLFVKEINTQHLFYGDVCALLRSFHHLFCQA